MNTQRLLVIGIVALALLAGTAAAERLAVSSLGYHPSSHKQVVVYEATSDAVTIDGNQYALTPTTCQGGQSCAVAEFSGLTTPGTYTVTTTDGATATVRISNNIYAEHVPTFLEFYQASLQQNSAYHEDLHRGMDPAFTMMADGSFIMEADQASRSMIRLGNAYRRNPGLFSHDTYTIAGGGADLPEYLAVMTRYLASLQDYDGTAAVSQGWNNDFQCAWTVRPSEPKWNDGDDPCMVFHSNTNNEYTAQAALAYTMVLEALQDVDATLASNTLARAQDTVSYLQGQSLNGEQQAYLGAAEFLLYDYTGDPSYPSSAHSKRGSISTQLSNEITRGPEYYWQTYIAHEAAINDAGLSYGEDPRTYFTEKIRTDWDGRWQDPISSNGERVYEYSRHVDFQTSRNILMEAAIAAKASEYSDDDVFDVVADQQLAWLTGQNSIQQGDGAGERRSYSFVFGIGDNPSQYHSRLMPWYEIQDGADVRFLNGLTYIPGWISGAFDSWNDGDRIYNHYDHWNAWKYTETTNEMNAIALETIAYLDAQRSGTAQPPTSTITPGDGTSEEPSSPTEDTNTSDTNTTDPSGGDDTTDTNTTSPDSGNDTTDTNTTSSGGETSDACIDSVQNLPVTCSGNITEDSWDGCRTVTCAADNSSLTVKSCAKTDGYEMYRLDFAGETLEICLGESCLSSPQGFAEGTLPYCAAEPATESADDSSSESSSSGGSSSDSSDTESSGSSSGGSSGSSGGSSTIASANPFRSSTFTGASTSTRITTVSRNTTNTTDENSSTQDMMDMNASGVTDMNTPVETSNNATNTTNTTVTIDAREEPDVETVAREEETGEPNVLERVVFSIANFFADLFGGLF